MLARWLGRESRSLAVPVLDGALKANRVLDEADVVAGLDAPEDLASDGASLYASDGARLVRLAPTREEVARFERPITALAGLPDGGIAVALGGTELRIVGGARDGLRVAQIAGRPLHAVNALSAAGSDRLLATDGSLAQPAERWKHDLMELGRTGRVFELDLARGEGRELASGLDFAFGACASDAGETWVCESWRHRVLALGRDGARRVVVEDLPGYPSRLAPARGGGWWLTCFAMRTQLVEFVLRETAFRKRMLREVDPRYWIAPSLRSGTSFLEPLQLAHLKTMGVVKPWAPPRSYGLVIRLDERGALVGSLHSRFDGTHHGIVSAVEHGGALYLLSKGSARVLRVTP